MTMPEGAATGFDRVGLVVHPRREIDAALVTIRAWAAEQGADVVQVPIPGQDRDVAPDAGVETCDLVLAVGGDGTTLAALHAAAPAGRPVMGIACGSLGALTAVRAGALPDALRRVAAGDWTPRRLPALALTARGEALGTALNDVVVVRAGASQVTVAVLVDGQPYVRFAGDGVIVATPLGSSAYTLAAGGPVLAEGAAGVVVTPLAPHGGTCPPLVAGAGARVVLEVEPGWAGARLELDGQALTAVPERLALAWVADHATLVGLGQDEPLLAGLRRRGILMDSPRVRARDARDAADGRPPGQPSSPRSARP
jgi:NAD+ kinase